MMNALQYLKPRKIIVQILGRHTIKTLYPPFQSSVVVVDVLDVIQSFGTDFAVRFDLINIHTIFSSKGFKGTPIIGT